MLLAARAHARQGFIDNKSLSEDVKIVESIQYAEEVAKILKENVVQGSAADGAEGAYSTSTRGSVLA
jgi:methylthioribose-1-phosphate isomerase